jgi:hypothetical protein
MRMRAIRWAAWVAAALAAAACSSSHKGDDTARPGPVAAAPAPAGPAAAEPTPAPTPAPASPDPGKVAVAAPDAAPAPAGKSFAAEARLLYRVVACGGDGPVPPRFDAKVVDRHCAWVKQRMDDFRTRYFEGGRAFFDKLVPKDVPTVVIYPFGGGDLISALVAFPDATEIDTISLEQAGDPRRIDTLSKRQLGDSLQALRGEIGGMLQVGSNTSENLSNSQQNDLPAQVSSFLMGLAAGGYEPVDMRYFRIEPDGALHYLSQADIDAIEAEGRAHARKLKGDWESPNFSQAFSNVEIRYRKIGETAVRIHRHIGWNLGDTYLAEHGELLAYLDAKGKVTMMTKGASYLLWRGDFSMIRDYMLSHLVWMLSDSTGIPPFYAKKAHMVQITYGRYDGAFLDGAENGAGMRHSDDFRKLWKKNKHRRMPFRFGYVDINKQAHLVVTRPRAAGK